MKIVSVVGARPNFMKIAPFVHAIERYNETTGSEKIEHLLVHTGQHYDDRMSKVFFESLGIPDAEIHLNVGSGSHAQQVGHTMIAFEEVLHREKPDWVVVVGDVNATMACAITAKKEHIRVCHIEAGLRSGDIDMPEEVNRLVTDRLSDLLLTPDPIASENLRKEGVEEGRIRMVGNIMIDTLEANRKKAEALSVEEIVRENALGDGGATPEKIDAFSLVTMHRPANVDRKEVLEPIVRFFVEEVAREKILLWPVHPRTRQRLEAFGLWERLVTEPNIVLLHPLNYHPMLRLNMQATAVLTDSGGLQEECCVLGTPCLTLRPNTERPVTLREHGGASILVGNDIGRIEAEYRRIRQEQRKPTRPQMWDGHTAERCVEAILSYDS